MDFKKVSEFLTPALWLIGGLVMLASIANAELFRLWTRLRIRRIS